MHRLLPIDAALLRLMMPAMRVDDVVLGDMPKPKMEWHRRRLSVIPGCTGLWQVAGRSAVDFNDMVILDLFYIDNMSPLFDLRIIFRTLPVMLLAKGGH